MRITTTRNITSDIAPALALVTELLARFMVSQVRKVAQMRPKPWPKKPGGADVAEGRFSLPRIEQENRNMNTISMSVARRRLKAPTYLANASALAGLTAIYLYLFQPFWPASKAFALLVLASVVFLTAVFMRKRAWVSRALLCGVPAVIAAGAWLCWLSSLPANTEAPIEDVEPLFADPQTRSDVLSAFRDNGRFVLSVEQLERIRASHK